MLKRGIALFFAIILLSFALCSCNNSGYTAYKDNERHFSISFPNSVTVFDTKNPKQSQQTLEDFQLSTSILKDLYNNKNVLFYGVSEDRHRRFFVASSQTSGSQQDWDFFDCSDETIQEYLDAHKEQFDEQMGRKMISEEILEINGAKYFKLEYTGTSNGIFLYTVKNGLYFAITVESDYIIDDATRTSADNIFQTIRFTRTIPKYQSRAVTVTWIIVAVVVTLAVITAAVIITVKLIRRRKDRKEEQIYRSVFDDDENE